jgi:tetratricopeptide (TPR) repeat protein
VALRGDLKSLNLGNVLQDLAYNSQTGTLRLHVGERRRFLWFEKGALRLVGLGLAQGPSIAAGLLALGKIGPADLETGARKTTDAARVNRLIREKKVTNADVKSALENQMTELVCDTFLWADAEFEFVGGDASSADFEVRQLDWEPQLACDAVTMEALRRVDEWTQIQKSVISAEEILLQSVPQIPDEADAQCKRLFALLDGERRLQDILNETHQGQFATFRAAATLLRSGWARPLDVKEARAKAEAHMAAKRPEKALGLVKFALSHEPHSPDLRKLAGRCLETLGKKDEAAAEYRILLAEETSHGRAKDAIETSRRVIGLAPKDTFTQEKLFQLLLETGTPEEALAQGEALAKSLKRAGMPDRARDVYERLLNKFDDNDAIMAALAEIAHHMGDKREAVTLYRKLFDRAVAASDEEMILERARTLLRLDPSLDEVARKRIEVETGMYRKNKARRRKVRFIIFGCLGLAVVASLGVMEWSARSALSKVRQLEDGFMYKQPPQVDKAVAKYNEFLDKYAWTLAAGDARERRDQLEKRLVEMVLPEVVKLDEEGNTYGALDRLDKILEVARSDKAVKEVREVRARFEKHRAEIEGEKLAEARKIAQEKASDRVKDLKTPLAIPALKLLLGEKQNPALRRAAVAALGEVGEPAIETLIDALAEEGESGELRGEILATLKKVAQGADYGTRAQDWEEWFLGKVKRPLQGLVLDAGSGMVEWRVLNVGRDTIKLDLLFGPVFKVTTTADGKELPMSIAFEAPAARRPIKASLKPGQFVGGRALLKDLVDVKGAEGQLVRVSWSLKLEGGEGEEGKLVSLPVRVEVKK